MQIFYFPDWVTVIIFVVFWIGWQAGISMLSNMIPDKRFNENSWFFKTRKWEKNGNIYNDIFRIRLWKHHLPDGAAAFDKGFRKKKLASLDEKYLEGFIKETCRAEWSHWIQILPFWVFGFFAPIFVIWIMLLYALILNLPCIIAQRYNRPRLVSLLNMKRGKKQK